MLSANDCSWLLGKESSSESSLLSDRVFLGALRSGARFFDFILEDVSDDAC